jgi:hypothetical protein
LLVDELLLELLDQSKKGLVLVHFSGESGIWLRGKEIWLAESGTTRSRDGSFLYVKG